MSAFANLRKQSQKNAADLGKKAGSEKSGGFQKDERFWTLDVDKSGNGSATIRFLPAPEGEEVPYVKRYEHFIKLNGKWYIENSLTTLGQEDPVTEHFFAIRGEGNDKKKNDEARPFSRNTQYISNIYVVNDPANPENNGKVFLYKYGQKIFDKIESALNPKFDDEQAMNPFDLWEGADFRLKAVTENSLRTYEKSSFKNPAPLLDDDEELEKIWKSEFSLDAEIAPNKFKSYDELKKKLDTLLDGKPRAAKNKQSEDDGESERPRGKQSRDDDDDAPQRGASGAGRRSASRDDDDDVKEEAPRRSAAKSDDNDSLPDDGDTGGGSDNYSKYRALLDD